MCDRGIDFTSIFTTYEWNLRFFSRKGGICLFFNILQTDALQGSDMLRNLLQMRRN